MIGKIASENPRLVVFSDLGSGYVDLFKKHLESDVIILDHHLPVDIEAENIVHVNPILQGLDGSREISGTGVSYLFAKHLDEKNIDLSPLGVVGALADQQDKGEKKSLLGLNKIIEEDAKKADLLETTVDLIFYGYETRPIAKACAYTTIPFIPGLSGREDKCLAFIKKAGIEPKRQGKLRALRDLTEEEKRSLFSALSNHMIYEGCEANKVHDLIGTIYTLKREEPGTPLRDGREHASLLNACARMGKSSLGISICSGERNGALKEAETILGDYRRKIGEGLDWVRETSKIEEMKGIYTLRAHREIDDSIIGVVASILLSTGILRKQKPIIAWAQSDENLLKISARGTEEMANNGLDLGEVMMKAAEPLGGRGGGHDTAAGAFIPEEREKEFMELVDTIVEKRSI
jgi:RecJ-like exonuclease